MRKKSAYRDNVVSAQARFYDAMRPLMFGAAIVSSNPTCAQTPPGVGHDMPDDRIGIGYFKYARRAPEKTALAQSDAGTVTLRTIGHGPQTDWRYRHDACRARPP
jgi:hypothetical protein